jgi:hypothetical protein
MQVPLLAISAGSSQISEDNQKLTDGFQCNYIYLCVIFKHFMCVGIVCYCSIYRNDQMSRTEMKGWY